MQKTNSPPVERTDQERKLLNEGYRKFFQWLKENPSGGIFRYLNLTLEVKKK